MIRNLVPIAAGLIVGEALMGVGYTIYQIVDGLKCSGQVVLIHVFGGVYV